MKATARMAAAKKAAPVKKAAAKKPDSVKKAAATQAMAKRPGATKPGAAKKAALKQSNATKPVAKKATAAIARPVAAPDRPRGAVHPVGGTRAQRSTLPGRATPLSSAPSMVLMSADLQRKVDGDEQLSNAVREMKSHVTFQVSPTTLSRLVLKEVRGRTSEHPIDDLRPDPDAVERAIDALGRLGIEVLRRGRFGVTCRGPTALVSNILKSPFRIVASARPSTVRSLSGSMEVAEAPRPHELSIVPQQSLCMAPNMSPAIDHFTFYPAPIYFHAAPAPRRVAPVPSWHHLSGTDLRRLLQVPEGADAPNGRGVRIAMVDSGFYPHPYFSPFDYQTINVPGNPLSSVDPDGHGTAMAWNVFQIAPQATLLGIGHTPVPSDALEVAAESNADIISCSWGYGNEQVFPALELTIRDLVTEGRSVLFAAGNGHYAWPGSMPEVLSVGGVYADRAGLLEASKYASGFQSSAYVDRRVPDLCGLVGQPPRAIYLILPCPPGCQMDKDLGGASFPDRDGTGPSDGWVGASGTSAATPQLAGIVALIKQQAAARGRVLSPADIKTLLQQSGVPISRGRNAQDIPATTDHPNGAVGFGLANATAAIALV